MACKNSFSRLLIVLFGFLFLAACGGGGGGGGTTTPTTLTRVATTMTTAAEVPQPTLPPVANAIGGSATFTLNTATNVITGSMTITGAFARVTAAHIHDGPVGVQGGVVVGLQDTGGGVWVVPPGFRALTAAEAAKFQAGEYYVNAHTADLNPVGGEIRGQLVP